MPRGVKGSGKCKGGAVRQDGKPRAGYGEATNIRPEQALEYYLRLFPWDRSIPAVIAEANKNGFLLARATATAWYKRQGWPERAERHDEELRRLVEMRVCSERVQEIFNQQREMRYLGGLIVQRCAEYLLEHKLNNVKEIPRLLWSALQTFAAADNLTGTPEQKRIDDAAKSAEEFKEESLGRLKDWQAKISRINAGFVSSALQ